MCTTEKKCYSQTLQLHHHSYSWAKKKHDEYLMLYIKVLILSTCSDPVMRAHSSRRTKKIHKNHTLAQIKATSESRRPAECLELKAVIEEADREKGDGYSQHVLMR